MIEIIANAVEAVGSIPDFQITQLEEDLTISENISTCLHTSQASCWSPIKCAEQILLLNKSGLQVEALQVLLFHQDL